MFDTCVFTLSVMTRKAEGDSGSVKACKRDVQKVVDKLNSVASWPDL